MRNPVILAPALCAALATHALWLAPAQAQIVSDAAPMRTVNAPANLVLVPPEALTADMLHGADVRDRAQESVAEVRDVVLSPEGRLSGLLVEIGGLWGIGAKRVAVPMARLTVLRPADAPLGATVRVQLDMTAEALKALPEA